MSANSTPNQAPAPFNITDAAAYLGIKPQSFRRAVHKGKVQGELVPHPTMTKVMRWEFTQEALDEYSSSCGQVGTRKDGRNKFTSYLTPEEYDQVIEVLLDKGFAGENMPSRANPPKSQAK